MRGVAMAPGGGCGRAGAGLGLGQAPRSRGARLPTPAPGLTPRPGGRRVGRGRGAPESSVPAGGPGQQARSPSSPSPGGPGAPALGYFGSSEMQQLLNALGPLSKSSCSLRVWRDRGVGASQGRRSSSQRSDASWVPWFGEA